MWGSAEKVWKRAAALANHLRRLRIASVWSRPLRCASQTAELFGNELELEVQIAAPPNEIDYGPMDR